MEIILKDYKGTRLPAYRCFEIVFRCQLQINLFDSFLEYFHCVDDILNLIQTQIIENH